MGITGFKKMIASCLVKKSLDAYRGKNIPVDGMHTIHKQCRGRRNNENELCRKDGKSIGHLFALFTFVVGMLQKQMYPKFVFDGKQPIEKRITIDERKHNKKKAQDICETICDKSSEEHTKWFKRTFHLSHTDIDECKCLLRAMGCDVIEAPMEADAQLAAISNIYNANIGGIITDDSDVLVYGGSIMLKDFSLRYNTVYELDRYKILSHLTIKTNEFRTKYDLEPIESFTHTNFIDFVVMLGSDYKVMQQNLHILGVSNANRHEHLFEIFVMNDLSVPKMIRYMEDENAINKLITDQAPYFIPHDYINAWYKIRDIYMNTEVINPDEIIFTHTLIDVGKVLKILCIDNNMNEHYVLTKLRKINKSLCKKFKYSKINKAESIAIMNTSIASPTTKIIT